MAPVATRGAKPAFASSTRPVIAGGVALATGYLLLLGWAMGRLSYDVWGALLIGPLMAALALALVLWSGRRQGDSVVTRILVAAVVAKLAGTAVRYFVTFYAYRTADARGYDRAGRELAAAFRLGDFNLGDIPLSNTRFIQVVTGAVYAVIGDTVGGAFLVFSLLSFVGFFFFYRAFCIAVPTGDHRRYAALLFFLPSVLYWPSSLGKDAWMAFAIGLTCYGAARLLSHRRGGLICLAIGLAACTAVRPHIALALVASGAAAYALRSSRNRSAFGPLAKVVGLIVLGGGALVLSGQVEEKFGLANLDPDSVADVLDRNETQTAQGGSRFGSVRVNAPADVPVAVVTVLFRPFPHEAENAQMLVASAEGVALLMLFAVGWRRLATAVRQIRGSPYLAFCVAYLLLFIVGFSTVVNFGVLARQRVQVLPLLLTLLCVPAAIRKPVAATGPRWVAGSSHPAHPDQGPSR
ncbi:MAG: hypothetical protein ACRD29_25550 [Acidimicrobiales bacterium]